MSDPLASVTPGDPPPLRADTWNGVLEAARAHRAGKRGGLGADNEHTPPVPSLVVWVKNMTGGSLPSFSVVALGEPVISAVTYPHDVNRGPVFPGTAPAAATDSFAVLLEPASASSSSGRQIVQAVVMGVVACDLNVTDEDHEFAKPAVGITATLASADDGPARIIWKDTGTGTKRAVVLLVGSGAGSAFPAELTSGYASGYSWKKLELSGTAFVDVSPAVTGTNNAYSVDDSESLASGHRVMMWLDVATGDYKFQPCLPTTTKGDLVVHDGTDDVRLAVGTDGYVLTADAAEDAGVKWASPTDILSAAGGLTWTKYTRDYTDFSAAAAVNIIDVATLASGTCVHAVVMKHTASFTGGAISTYGVSALIHDGAGSTGISTGFNVFWAPGTQASLGKIGNITVQAAVYTIGATSTFQLSAACTGASLNAATAGSLDVWLLTSTLPP